MAFQRKANTFDKMATAGRLVWPDSVHPSRRSRECVCIVVVHRNNEYSIKQYRKTSCLLPMWKSKFHFLGQNERKRNPKNRRQPVEASAGRSVGRLCMAAAIQ